jgi:hypothetical protein
MDICPILHKFRNAGLHRPTHVSRMGSTPFLTFAPWKLQDLSPTPAQPNPLLLLSPAPCCIFWLLYGICCCCAPCYSKSIRSTIRANYALKEAPCSDCCVHFWCIGCAVCQEARELKNRGVAQHGQFIQAPVTYAPPPQQQM